MASTQNQMDNFQVLPADLIDRLFRVRAPLRQRRRLSRDVIRLGFLIDVLSYRIAPSKRAFPVDPDTAIATIGVASVQAKVTQEIPPVKSGSALDGIQRRSSSPALLSSSTSRHRL